MDLKKRDQKDARQKDGHGIMDQYGEPLLNIERQAKRRDAFVNYVFMWKAKIR